MSTAKACDPAHIVPDESCIQEVSIGPFLVGEYWNRGEAAPIQTTALAVIESQ